LLHYNRLDLNDPHPCDRFYLDKILNFARRIAGREVNSLTSMKKLPERPVLVVPIGANIFGNPNLSEDRFGFGRTKAYFFGHFRTSNDQGWLVVKITYPVTFYQYMFSWYMVIVAFGYLKCSDFWHKCLYLWIYCEWYIESFIFHIIHLFLLSDKFRTNNDFRTVSDGQLTIVLDIGRTLDKYFRKLAPLASTQYCCAKNYQSMSAFSRKCHLQY